MIKTGVSTASCFNRMTNEDTLSLFDNLGIKETEAFLTTFCEYDTKFADLLNERKGNVHIHSVHDLNTQFESQLFNENERVRNDAYYWLGKVMETAQRLGAKYYTFHALARIKRSSKSGINDNFKAWGEGFEKIRVFCEKYGVTLCLENVEWATYNRPGVLTEIKKYCPNLHCVLDTKQARISEFKLDDYMKEMQGSLTHVHVSDIDENGKICLPGKGKFDFETFIKRLDDTGFDGPMLIEVYKDDYKEYEELKRACDYLDELIYKLKKS